MAWAPMACRPQVRPTVHLLSTSCPSAHQVPSRTLIRRPRHLLVDLAPALAAACGTSIPLSFASWGTYLGSTSLLPAERQGPASASTNRSSTHFHPAARHPRRDPAICLLHSAWACECGRTATLPLSCPVQHRGSKTPALSGVRSVQVSNPFCRCHEGFLQNPNVIIPFPYLTSCNMKDKNKFCGVFYAFKTKCGLHKLGPRLPPQFIPHDTLSPTPQHSACSTQNTPTLSGQCPVPLIEQSSRWKVISTYPRNSY